MTTIDVQTAISPAVLFRMYEQMSHQDMYGGGARYDLSQGRAAMPYERLTVGGAVMDPAAASGTVTFPIVLDQSALANRPQNFDYAGQYVASNDDAKAERLKAEYAGFYDQWVKATLSNYK
jgi:hypothetical protein